MSNEKLHRAHMAKDQTQLRNSTLSLSLSLSLSHTHTHTHTHTASHLIREHLYLEPYILNHQMFPLGDSSVVGFAVQNPHFLPHSLPHSTFYFLIPWV